MIGTHRHNQPTDGADLIAKTMKIVKGHQLQRRVMETGGGGIGPKKEKPYGNAEA